MSTSEVTIPPDTPTAPLAGVRVLENATFITGPLAGQLLAQLGAQVIKLEPPGGDGFRAGDDSGRFPRFAAHNRGKRSVVCDLRAADGKTLAHRLLADADVFIENARPGAMDRLGFGFDELARQYPRLIYCSISGFGRQGPDRVRPGYDAVGQAASGLMSMLVDPARPRPVGPALSDTVTGIMAAFAVTSGLVKRAQTGRGSHVTTSMLQATMAALVEPVSHYIATGEVPGLYSRPAQSQSYAFTTADERVLVVHLSSPKKFWEALVAVVERPELLTDERFETYPQRVAAYAVLEADLQETFGRRPLEQWLRRCAEFDLPASAVNSVADAITPAALQSAGFLGTGTGDPAGPNLPPFHVDSYEAELSPAPRLNDLGARCEGGYW